MKGASTGGQRAKSAHRKQRYLGLLKDFRVYELPSGARLGTRSKVKNARRKQHCLGLLKDFRTYGLSSRAHLGFVNRK